MSRPKGSSNRPKRRPMHDGYRNTLSYSDQDPKFVYRVFNDADGRITRGEEAGYEVVRSSQELGDATVETPSALGSAVSRPVGGGMNGVLMRIPRELYEEDQAEKQNRVDASEAGLNHKKVGQYGDVRINHGSRRPTG